jgi:uncharacterized membrane protein
MSTATLETIRTMLQSLPQPAQERALEHLREYLQDVSADLSWDESFAKSQGALSDIARQAKAEHATGECEPMDLNRL